VVGDNGVESAPYTLIESDIENDIEIRNYDSMILVSASMKGEGRNSAFRKLFKYITGANSRSTEIAMTAPVFMDDQNQGGQEIAMTAPVFMDNRGNEQMMSFVMPKDFTLQSTPKPTDPDVVVTEVKDYKVAAVRFSGTLSKTNVKENTEKLTTWMEKHNYQQKSEAITAGYNGPLTLPMFRHNEVLIEIE
jgi:effector-binding domain-containing protein